MKFLCATKWEKTRSNANIVGKNALNHVTHWLSLEDNVAMQSCADLVTNWVTNEYLQSTSDSISNLISDLNLY